MHVINRKSEREREKMMRLIVRVMENYQLFCDVNFFQIDVYTVDLILK